MSNPYDDIVVRTTRAATAPAATDSANPYDGIVAGLPESGDRLKQSAIAASHLQPDTVARAQRVAAETGMPASTLARNPTHLDRLDRQQRLDRVRRSNPALADWLAEPARMAVAQDDIDGLDRLGAAVQGPSMRATTGNHERGWGEFFGDMGLQFKQMARLGVVGLAETPVNAVNLANRQLNNAARGLAGLFGESPETEVGMLPQPNALREFRADTEALNAAEFEQGASFKLSAQQRERPTSFFGALRYMVTNPSVVATDLAGVGGTMVSGIVPGSTAATLGVQAGSQASMAAADVAAALKAKGYSEADAQAAATDAFGWAAAAGVVIPRLTPGGTAFEGVVAGQTTRLSGSPLRRTAVAAVGEPVSEMAEEGAVQVAQNVYSAEDWDRGVGGAMAQGLVAGTAMGAPAAASQYTAGRREQALSGEVARLFSSAGGSARLSAMGEAARATKLGERSPEALGEFARAAGATGHVYLQAEQARVLFQSDFDLASLVGGEDALVEQVNAGDLVIPMDRWLSVVSRLPNAAEIERHARLRADDLSAAELEGFDADAELARLGFVPDTEEAGTRAEVGEPDGRQRIVDDVLGQLLGTGRYSQSTAEAQASLWGAAFTRFGEIAGQDPLALFQRYMGGINDGTTSPLRTRRWEGSAQLDAVIDAVRSGAEPDAGAMNGPSLLAFLAGQGGLQDQGGELMARDATKLRPGLVRKQGLALDRARELAAEAGYIPADTDLAPLLDAIDAELRGSPVYSEANRDQVRSQFDLDRQLLLQAIEETPALRDLPVEQFNALTNQQIADVLFGGATFDQAPYQPAVPQDEEIERLRARVAELERELRTDALTGLRNQRAFEEDEALGWPAVAAADMDGLKRLNDSIGHEAADQVLRALGGIFLASEGEGIRFYRRSGDEFAARFQSAEAADRVMADIQARLEQVAIDFDVADAAGAVRSLRYEGIGISYGTGQDYAAADAGANENKRVRLESGQREEARSDGEPRRLRPRGDTPWGEGRRRDDQGQARSEMNQTPPQGGVSASAVYDQPAYHGTPHTVDRFSLQRIGTGEGNQAYGWGLYFASNREIAEYYRRTLAGGDSYSPKVRNEVTDMVGYGLTDGRTIDEAKAEARQRLERDLARAKGYGLTDDAGLNQYIANVEANLPALDALTLEDFTHVKAGKLYAVEVPEDSDLLDWDKPLSEQPEKVKEALRPLIARFYGDKNVDHVLSGGEGSPGSGKDFYDEIAANPRQASEMLQDAGIPGLRFLDGSSRKTKWKLSTPEQTAAGDWMVKDANQPNSKGLHFGNEADALAELERRQQAAYNYVIWDESAVSAPVQLLDQAGEAAPRGQIRIAPDRSMSISLFERADRTTFLHESGHFFFEVFADIATAEDAPQQARDDFAALLAWFGVESREQVGTEQHEQFARGFEAYLGEGRAPSPALQSVFSQFKAWVLSIYKTLRNLNVQLTDDVRGVFDRMLASEEEIEAAQVRQGMAPLVADPSEARALGLTDKQFADYQAMVAAATEEARADVMAKLMKAHDRARQAWWKEESAKVRAEVEAEYEAQPVVRALRILSGRKTVEGQPVPEALQIKLDKAAIVGTYGEAYLKRLGRTYAVEGGVHPDLAASLLGFDSGDALLKGLANVKDTLARVHAEVADRMRERHGDPMTDGTLPEMAMDAVHNAKRVQLLEHELGLLATLANQPPIDRRRLKAAAQTLVARKTARQLRPNDYLAAERRAAREATQAAAKGDYAAALLAKRQQALNVALYSAARRAERRAAARVRFLRKAAKATTRKRIGKTAGKAYVEALDAILAGHEFRSVSGKEVTRRASLREWVARMQKEGHHTAVSDELLARVESERAVSVQDLTLTQLDELHDAVKNLLHLASVKNKLKTKRGRIEWEDAKAAMIARLEQQESRHGRRGLSAADRTLYRAALDAYAEGANWLLQPETLVEWLDGDTDGPFHELLWDMSEEAENHRNALKRRVGALLKTAIDALPAAERKALDTVWQIDSLGEGVTGHSILSALMNMGNAGNRDKLLRGGRVVGDQIVPFDEVQLAEMFSKLTAEQARVVQGVWDAVNSLWPDIVAMEEELNGIAPEKVEAQSFTVMTKDGPVPLRGGYFPVKYDPAGAQAAQFAEDEQAQRVLSGQTGVRATTSKGHTQSRTDFTAPLLLDWNHVLSSHLDGVMSDIAYRQFLTQATKVLRDADVRRMIDNRVGPGAARGLLSAMERGATGSYFPNGMGTNPLMRVTNKTMVNASVAALGLRVPLALANIVTAPILASARVSPKALFRGYLDYFTSMPSSIKAIHALSPQMLKRAEARSAEYAALLDTLRGKRGMKAKVTELSMVVHQWIVPLAENAIWLSAYKQALPDYGAESAVRLADKAIRQTQTKHSYKDVSDAEANPYLKPLMMFAGPLLVINNRLQESGLRGLRGTVTSPIEALGVWLAMAAGGALLFELMMGRGPDDEDDDGDEDVADWLRWTGKQLAMLPFAGIPGLRDAVSYLDKGFVTGVHPLVGAAKKLVSAGKKTFDEDAGVFSGDADPYAVGQSWVGAASVFVPIPSNQIKKTGDYLMEVGTGEHTPRNPAEEAYYLMQGPPKDKP